MKKMNKNITKHIEKTGQVVSGQSCPTGAFRVFFLRGKEKIRVCFSRTGRVWGLF